MGHIKEPKGVDFVIESGPLSREQEASLTRYINDYKAKSLSKKNAEKKKVSKLNSI